MTVIIRTITVFDWDYLWFWGVPNKEKERITAYLSCKTRREFSDILDKELSRVFWGDEATFLGASS